MDEITKATKVARISLFLAKRLNIGELEAFDLVMTSDMYKKLGKSVDLQVQDSIDLAEIVYKELKTKGYTM